MSKKQSVQCCVWDFTLFDDINVADIRKVLKDYCKKYAFQLEEGKETKKKHYQGRFSLKTKKRQHEVVGLFGSWKKFHISLTSSANKENEFYVLKEDTRIDGPWTNENEIFIPNDIKKFSTLLPWQESLKERLSKEDFRVVDYVYDEEGCKGKTIFTRHMMLFHGAALIPFCNDYKDVMRMAYDIGEKDCYLIDMPRAINKDKLYQMYSAIESLKGGYCYDDRYAFKQRLFNPPRICVFSNKLPDVKLLSMDRWKIWIIDSKGKLKKYTP